MSSSLPNAYASPTNPHQKQCSMLTQLSKKIENFCRLSHRKSLKLFNVINEYNVDAIITIQQADNSQYLCSEHSSAIIYGQFGTTEATSFT